MAKAREINSDYVSMDKFVPKGNCSGFCCRGQVTLDKNSESQGGINSDSQQTLCQLTRRSVLRRNPCSRQNTEMSNSLDNSLPPLVMDLDEEPSTSSPTSPTVTYTPGNQAQRSETTPPAKRVPGCTSRKSPAKALADRAKRKVTVLDICSRCKCMHIFKELPAHLPLTPKLCQLCRSQPCCPQCGSHFVDYNSTVIHKPFDPTEVNQRRVVSITWCNSKECSYPCNWDSAPYQYEEISIITWNSSF